MRVYSVHIRRHGLDLDGDIAVVKEGYSWPGFVFAPLWALWHRHWLVAAVLVAVPALIGGLSTLIGANPPAQTALSLGWSVFVGMMANDVRRYFLERAGFVEAGVAAGRHPDDALLAYLREPEEAPAADGRARESGLL